MAAAAGMEALVFCNADAPALQIAMMEHYGARVVRGGDSEAMLRQLLARGGWFPCTVLSPRAGYSNPFGVEGFKTIAFELVAELGHSPDRVFVGVGSGDGVYGIWKGFRELQELGAITSVPRIYGCQTAGANSLVRAVRTHAKAITPLESARSLAASLVELAVGNQALQAIYESGGDALEVTDDQALASMRWIARQGIALVGQRPPRVRNRPAAKSLRTAELFGARRPRAAGDRQNARVYPQTCRAGGANRVVLFSGAYGERTSGSPVV